MPNCQAHCCRGGESRLVQGEPFHARQFVAPSEGIKYRLLGEINPLHHLARVQEIEHGADCNVVAASPGARTLK